MSRSLSLSSSLSDTVRSGGRPHGHVEEVLSTSRQLSTAFYTTPVSTKFQVTRDRLWLKVRG